MDAWVRGPYAGGSVTRRRLRPARGPTARRNRNCRSETMLVDAAVGNKLANTLLAGWYASSAGMSSHPRRISRALLSVSDKAGLVAFATELARYKVELISTGGTAKALTDAGLAVTDVSEVTGLPEMMDGRVKTLHPKVHGGLLAVRANKEHVAAMEKHHIKPIDLLVVNLYPFEATVAKDACFEDCIENIDIGGPAMIRAAAKNHMDVTVVVEPADYEKVLGEMAKDDGMVSLRLRQSLAAKAY